MDGSLIEMIKVFILAVVQGIGEFLPISSSGHLLVLGDLFFGGASELENGELMTLGILLHAGTLLSILIVFRHQIFEMLVKNQRLILLLIVASFPTGVIGITIHEKFTFLETNVFVAGVGFLLTAWLLFRYMAPKKQSYYDKYIDEETDDTQGYHEEPKKTLTTMTYLDALIIGCFQTIAILPGCSRSGFTISAGLFRHLKQEDAAAFSFLLAIPAIGGATLLEVKNLLEGSSLSSLAADPSITLFLTGSAVSFAVGLVSLIYLLKWLKKGKLHYFGYWLLMLGPAVIAWQLYTMFLMK